MLISTEVVFYSVVDMGKTMTTRAMPRSFLDEGSTSATVQPQIALAPVSSQCLRACRSDPKAFVERSYADAEPDKATLPSPRDGSVQFHAPGGA